MQQKWEVSFSLFQLQKSKEREERLEEVIQAYEKIHLEKSNVQRDLDKMVTSHCILSVKQQFGFDLNVCLCASDDSSRAACGADLQSGVSSQTERNFPSETQRSTPQQRRTSVSTPRQPGRTQRWVLFDRISRHKRRGTNIKVPVSESSTTHSDAY